METTHELISWLSLVVIFTQSIQLSKIVRGCQLQPLRALERARAHGSRFRTRPVVADVLNIEQVSPVVTFKRFWWS